MNYSIYGNLIDELVSSGAHKATKIISDKRTIVATRRLFRGKPDKRTLEVLVTDGRPNFENRRHIKHAKKMGMAFPLRQIRLTFPPKRRKA